MISQLPTSSTSINKWRNVEKWVLVLLNFMGGQIYFFMVANKRCLDFHAPEEQEGMQLQHDHWFYKMTMTA